MVTCTLELREGGGLWQSLSTAPSDGITTTLRQVGVAGSAEPGSTVGLFDTYGYITDTVAVDEDGEWGLIRGLFGGNNELYAVAENGYGVGPESNHVLVGLAPRPPLYPPAIVLPPTIHNGQVVTFSTNARDDNPDEGRPTVAVTATLLTLEVGLTQVSSQGITGTWQATRTVSGMNDGDYRARFVGVDGDGYVGDGESTLRVRDVPPAPRFTYPTEPVTRSSASLNVSGWAQPFTTLRLYDDGSLLTSLPLNIEGSWGVPVTLGEGRHAITATATDRWGQVSPPGAAGTVLVDSVPPEQASLDPLTPYRNQQAISLRWSADDPAPGTGVASYDLQHRLDTGPWQTIEAGTTLTETSYWGVEGAHTFRVRARDGVHNEGDYSPQVWTVVDLTPPDVTLTLSEHSPYAHTDDTLYYAENSGSFTVTAVLTDPSTGSGQAAGLAQVAFPDTTSPGTSYALYGLTSATRFRTYTFTVGVDEEGVYEVAATDRATNLTEQPFAVVRDTTPPTFTLSPAVESGALRVAWSATDTASGVDAGACTLELREDAGDWQPFSTACAGDEVHTAAQPGHVYTFRLSASDNVSNPASATALARFPRVTKYYYFGGQRVAMRADGVVYYLHGDHPSAGSGQAWAPPAW